jgi:hypothetical protein
VPVNHGVIDLAGGIVAFVFGSDEFTAQFRIESLYGCFVKHAVPPYVVFNAHDARAS